MPHSPGDEFGASGHDPSRGSTGGVHFEETIALSDSRFAELADLAGVVFLVTTAAMVLLVPLGFVGFIWVVSVASRRPFVDVADAIVSGLPPGTSLLGAVFAATYVGGLLFAVWQVLRRGSVAYRDEIHTRVTDDRIAIDRTGGYIGQASGVTIPLEAIVTVEYNRPGGDLRVVSADVRAEQFIGGRASDWVRIERRGGPAVYVGSDRHRALAGTLADLAPRVDAAEPFS
jgi:hypothetical protein